MVNELRDGDKNYYFLNCFGFWFYGDGVINNGVGDVLMGDIVGDDFNVVGFISNPGRGSSGLEFHKSSCICIKYM
jgi:hypothetical protein